MRFVSLLFLFVPMMSLANRVALIGPFPKALVSAYQSTVDSKSDFVFVGSGFKGAIDYFRLHPSERFDTVVFMPEVTPTWTSERDSFVPNLKSMIVRARTLTQAALVIVANVDSKNDIEASEVVPLTKQAARESGVPVVELNEFGSPGAPETDRLAMLAIQLGEAIEPKALSSQVKLVAFSSEEASEGPAANAVDGDPETYWHSQYSPTIARPPHFLILDLGQSSRLIGLTYLPRQDGGTNGNAKDYAVYVGESLETLIDPVVVGKFANGTGRQFVRFPASVSGRFVKFEIRSAQNGAPYGGAAEVQVLAARN